MSLEIPVKDVSDNFIGGQLFEFYEHWEYITQDEVILGYIKGVKLEFLRTPMQNFVPREIKCSFSEKEKIDKEIEKFLKKKIIFSATHSEGEFISQIFPRDKKSGDVRIVLNLSKLNEDVKYEHFKMEGLGHALSLMTKGCFFGSIDLQDAYFTVSIDPQFRKYLRFFWRGNLYEFTCMPNGYSAAPRVFTKLMKPIFSTLRSEGFLSVFYLDDSLLVANSFQECHRNLQRTEGLLKKAGFIINQKKSSFIPSQEILFLGFILNSDSMTVRLPEDKVDNIIKSANDLLSHEEIKIRKLARFIGLVVSVLPAMQHGALFYRYLELDKIQALKRNCGDFEKNCILSQEGKEEVDWWRKNICRSGKSIEIASPTFYITTDASKSGWGCILETKSANGNWTEIEAEEHINVLELKAIYFGLKSFFKSTKSAHIRIKSDNTTAIAYINSMGGVKSKECLTVAKEIWTWAIDHDLHLSAEHIPGSKNVLADKASRVFDENTEWELMDRYFSKIHRKFGSFDIDLFASRLNKKVDKYCAWKPDPFAVFIDVFSANWASFYFYAFPPFSMVLRSLEKVAREEASGVIVVPLWTTQVWFPKLMNMLTAVPLVLPLGALQLPFKKEAKHKLAKNLRLVVCPISGNDSRSKAFLSGPLTLCVPHGQKAPPININTILKDGIISVLGSTLIPCLLV